MGHLTIPSIAEDATRRAALLLIYAGIPAVYHHPGGGCMVTYVPLGHDDAEAIYDHPRIGICADQGDWPTVDSPETGYFIVRYESGWDDEGTTVTDCATADEEMLDTVRRLRAELAL
jgi:hypothetical protein